MSITLHTNLGDLKIELFCQNCPLACKNFLALCAKGYYDKTIFHRNIKNFIIQGGDPTGTGKGGQSIYDQQPFQDEIFSDIKHDKRGILGMANSGPHTNQSQFYITYSKAPHIDNMYTIFGQVIDGWSTLDKMEQVPVNNKDRPLNEIEIQGVTIHANPIADNEG